MLPGSLARSRAGCWQRTKPDSAARNETAAGGWIFHIRQSLTAEDSAVIAGEPSFLRRVVCYVPLFFRLMKVQKNGWAITLQKSNWNDFLSGVVLLEPIEFCKERIWQNEFGGKVKHFSFIILPCTITGSFCLASIKPILMLK